MGWLHPFLTCLALLLLGGCDSRPLPFPTPAQRDLVVLVQEGPLTYSADDNDKISGLEYDLIEAFARDLGVGVRYIVTTPEEMDKELAVGKAHFAAAWFTPAANDPRRTSLPIIESSDLLVQHEASLPVDDLARLTNRTVHVMAGSRQAAALRQVKAGIPEVQIMEYDKGSVFHLLEEVEQRDAEMALVDSSFLDIALQYTPSIQATFAIGDPRPIVWLFGEKANSELLARANAFIERSRLDGTLARLEDRYLGHVRRLRQADVLKFFERTETVLPKLRSHFYAAQNVTGLDWRLLAALAYHESQWDPNAVSPTGVRGIMMLTEETADRLGVSNRLDPKESIMAGARYLGYLRNTVSDTAQDPDRTWLALAAYNLGPGHFNAGRNLAKQLNADPDSWYEMKRILPLLAQPKYYQKLKSGRARGGEAVLLAENIRSYYDILTRYEEPYLGAPLLADKAGAAAGGLKAGRAPGLKPQ